MNFSIKLKYYLRILYYAFQTQNNYNIKPIKMAFKYPAAYMERDGNGISSVKGRVISSNNGLIQVEGLGSLCASKIQKNADIVVSFCWKCPNCNKQYQAYTDKALDTRIRLHKKVCWKKSH